MTETNDDIDVLIDEAPKPDDLNGVEVVKADEVAAPETPKVLEPAEALETLKAQLDAEKAATAEERRARLAAEQREHEQSQRVVQAQTETQDTNLQLLINAFEQAKQNTEVYKARYAEAMSAGDYAAAADIQSEMAENAAKKLQFEFGISKLKNAPKPTAERAAIIDPVEALAAQLAQNGSPRSATWVRSHPEYASGKNYNKMISAHNMAIADDFIPDSPEYFAEVERYLGISKPAETSASGDALSEAAQPIQRRVSPPAAPVSRNGTASGEQRNIVRLTADEREAAYASWPNLPPAEAEKAYAVNKQSLVKEGRLN